MSLVAQFPPLVIHRRDEMHAPPPFPPSFFSTWSLFSLNRGWSTIIAPRYILSVIIILFHKLERTASFQSFFFHPSFSSFPYFKEIDEILWDRKRNVHTNSDSIMSLNRISSTSNYKTYIYSTRKAYKERLIPLVNSNLPTSTPPLHICPYTRHIHA